MRYECSKCLVLLLAFAVENVVVTNLTLPASSFLEAPGLALTLSSDLRRYLNYQSILTKGRGGLPLWLFGTSWGHLGESWGQGLAKRRPEDPERPQDTPKEAPRGPQVGAQEGPEGPKMHPREGKDDVGNENEESLKNDDPLNENA